MRALKLTRTVVMIAGCLRPQSWTTLRKRVAYNIYRSYVTTMLFIFAMAQLLDMILIIDNTDDFIDNLNMLLVSSASCYKTFLMRANEEKIVELINILDEEPFKPLDQSEIKIRRKFDQIIR